jgi:hypothetical protein
MYIFILATWHIGASALSHRVPKIQIKPQSTNQEPTSVSLWGCCPVLSSKSWIFRKNSPPYTALTGALAFTSRSHRSVRTVPTNLCELEVNAKAPAPVVQWVQCTVVNFYGKFMILRKGRDNSLRGSWLVLCGFIWILGTRCESALAPMCHVARMNMYMIVICDKMSFLHHIPVHTCSTRVCSN